MELISKEGEVEMGKNEVEKKRNRHVVVAINHMNKRQPALIEQRAKLTKEIEELDAAILALE